MGYQDELRKLAAVAHPIVDTDGGPEPGEPMVNLNGQPVPVAVAQVALLAECRDLLRVLVERTPESA